MIDKNIIIKQNQPDFLNRLLVCLLISALFINSYAENGGIIVLNQPAPETSVIVTATEQVILKPGFRASAATGTFNAKIGASNAIAPLFNIAEESAFQIPVASTDQNYIKTSIALKADANSPMVTTIQYFDGLGRPSQTVQMGITPEGADLVSLTQYDGVGREWKNWLPTPTVENFGQYVNESSFTSNASSKHNDNNPYAEIRYECSPLNRIEEQFGAGASWHTNSKRITTAYSTNDDNIANYSVNESGNLVRGDNYDSGTLYKTIVSDEDGKPVTEYKDKLGQVIMKQSGSDVYTYFVYNDLGQLSYVIPPIAVDSLPNTTGPIYDNNGVLKRYAYLYKYDERGNQIYKRLPGCDPVLMVYDKANRLILSQDGNQKIKQQWLVNKYDVLGRLLYTGITEDNSSHEDLIADMRDEVITETWDVNNDIDNTGYTCGRFTPEKLLTVNYYDNYNFVSMTDANLDYDTSKDDEYKHNKHPSAKGLLTGTRTYLLDGSNNYTATALYYDYKGQMIQSRSSNHLGGYDYIYNRYNFTGNVTKTLKQHGSLDDNSDPHKISELYVYSYDHALRLVTTTYILNSNPPILLALNKYDELGHLVERKRHNNTDTEQFEYNIRGWTTKIKSGDFEQNLYYNTGLPQGATACYNGNIAYSTWKYNNFTSGYEYQYDELNRLTDSYFKDVSSNNYYDNGCYDERFIFDKQGNIKTLTRTIYGSDVDYLTLSYIGNQLTKVTDGEGSWASYNIKEYHDKANLPLEFFYDPNGNLTKDLDRNIDTIKYNLLNLPDTIQFSNGNQIVHTYDAGGRKFRTEYFTLYTPIQIPLSGIYNWNNRWDVLDTWEVKAYVGNFEYHQFKDSHDDYYSLIRINNTEGYVTSLTSPSYNYYRKDHVGNNREVWKAVANTTIQRTQYYPSGLPIEFNNGDNPGWQPYKYGGKEFVEMHGYDSYYFHARILYPAIGPQFVSVDPLAEDYYDVSPYAYGLNNPIRYNDPTGMTADDVITIHKDIPEVTVTADRYNPVGSRAFDPVLGLWGWIEYLMFGRTYESGNYYNGDFPVIRATWNVDSYGIVTGVQPLTGTPPVPTFKGGSLFIKGFKYVDKLNFHKVLKPKILKEARKVQDFSKVVGSNPDITIVNSKIVLQGAKNSPFAGRTLKTELKVIDFFK